MIYTCIYTIQLLMLYSIHVCGYCDSVCFHRCFSKSTVEGILDALTAEDTDWARKVLQVSMYMYMYVYKLIIQKY